ncbi:MAG: alanine racemase [Alphaproteobacteria bacterium]|nr:alanine racemase [Alphaproteobacteria bacterium]
MAEIELKTRDFLSAAQAEALFDFEPVGASLHELETPVPIIDFDVMLANLIRWQMHCDRLGIANWPHIKTHKLVPMAKLQIALGAAGLCVQKLGEAEVMAAAGLHDMLLTFNVVGESKVRRLAAVMRNTNIAVVADNETMLAGLADAAKSAGRKLEVLVECDTGLGRNGVQTPAAALALAQAIASSSHLTFGGLMTYPPAFKRQQVASFIASAKELLQKAGVPCPRVSSGGSKDLWDDAGLADVTEYRAGTYIYNDRQMVAAKSCTFAQCAEHVLATVVSVPTAGRAIIDAGSKALTSDLGGVDGYGVVPELGFAKIYAVNEEHGYLDISAAPRRPKVGERVKIVMNHTCPVNNLFDKVVFGRGDRVLGAIKIDARGKVQ